MKFRAYLILIIVSILHYKPCQASEPDSVLIRNVCNKYHESIRINSGISAIDLFDSMTIIYFDSLLFKSQHLDSNSIAKSDLFDQLAVLMIRHLINVDTLRKMRSGRDLLIYGIDNNLYGKFGSPNDTMGTIIINNKVAKGKIIYNGQESNQYYLFHYENDTWKINIIYNSAEISESFKKSAIEGNYGFGEYIIRYLEWSTGRNTDKNIWNPPF